jgi:hypothetical protein
VCLAQISINTQVSYGSDLSNLSDIIICLQLVYPKCQSCLAICRETRGRKVRQTRCTGPAIGTQCCPTPNHIVGFMALALVSMVGSLLHYAWRCGTVWASVTQSSALGIR